jgi:hypothetical protein
MLHAVRNHWRSFATQDPAVTMFVGPSTTLLVKPTANGRWSPAVTMFVGPSTTAVPLEIAVIQDEQGTATIHAMRARREFLRGWKAP